MKVHAKSKFRVGDIVRNVGTGAREVVGMYRVGSGDIYYSFCNGEDVAESELVAVEQDELPVEGARRELRSLPDGTEGLTESEERFKEEVVNAYERAKREHVRGNLSSDSIAFFLCDYLPGTLNLLNTVKQLRSAKEYWRKKAEDSTGFELPVTCDNCGYNMRLVIRGR